MKTMDETVSVRVATPHDAAAIRSLTRAAYAKWVPVVGREPMPMTVDCDAAVKTHRFDLLETRGELAALIETAPQGDELLIVNVAVAPGHQGRGFGVRLMKLAEDLAASAGMKGTRLYTNKMFEVNIALYLSLGYQVEREEARNGGLAVHMVKAQE